MPSDIHTLIARCDAELAAIEAYEQGPPKNDPAWLGALWRADWEANKRLLQKRLAKATNARGLHLEPGADGVVLEDGAAGEWGE